MVIYIYGDDIYTGRKKLNFFLDQFLAENESGRIVTIKSSSFDPVIMRSQARSRSLFKEQKIYLIEQPQKFNSSQQKKLLEIASKIEDQIIFWDTQETNLTFRLKKYFPELKIFHFPQPKLTFKFLEAVYPNNQKVFLPLLQHLIQEQPAELIFYFLKKHCHNLILITDKAQANKFPGWRQQKLEAQLQNFPLEKLVHFYRELIELEYKEKTGQLGNNFYLALVNLMATL